MGWDPGPKKGQREGGATLKNKTGPGRWAPWGQNLTHTHKHTRKHRQSHTCTHTHTYTTQKTHRHTQAHMHKHTSTHTLAYAHKHTRSAKQRVGKKQKKKVKIT